MAPLGPCALVNCATSRLPPSAGGLPVVALAAHLASTATVGTALGRMDLFVAKRTDLSVSIY